MSELSRPPLREALEALGKRRRQAEAAIAEVMRAQILAFEEETGTKVDGVQVSFVRYETIGKSYPVIDDLRLEVRIP